MKWKITAYPWSTPANAVELRGAVSRSFVMRLRAPHTAQFTISGNHPDSLRLTELLTDIKIACDSGSGYQTCFLGRCSNTQDTLSEDVHTVSFQFSDYKWLLDRRLMLTEATFASAEIADTAWALINTKQSETNGAMGIVDSGVNTGISKQMTHAIGDSVFDKIDDLADTSPRAEWDINPDTKAFQMYYPQRGVSNGVILEYGRAVSAMTRTRVGSQFANSIIGTGGEGTNPYVKNTAAVIAGTDQRGKFEMAANYSDDVIQATLDGHIDALIPYTSELSGAYNVTLKKGWWRGPSHLWLGDTITWKMNKGRISESFTMRVFEIGVGIGDDGEETTRMVLVK